MLYAFKIILMMSITGTMVFMMLCAFKVLFGKWLSKTAIYCGMLIVLIFLSVPFLLINSDLHFFNEKETQLNDFLGTYWNGESETDKNEVISGEKGLGYLGSEEENERNFHGTVVKSKLLDIKNNETKGFCLMKVEELQNGLAYVWIMITLFLSIRYFVLRRKSFVHIFKYSFSSDSLELVNCLERCKVKLNVKCKIEVRIDPNINTPLLMGIFNKTIVLPNINLKEEELEFIFYHELHHLKQRDNLVCLIAKMIGYLHWFNPIIYIYLARLNKAYELSCDEKVANPLDEMGRKQYASTIITVIEQSQAVGKFHFTTLCSDKVELKGRLENIMYMRQKSRGIRIFMVVGIMSLAVLGILSCFALSPHAVHGALAEPSATLTTFYERQNPKLSGVLELGLSAISDNGQHSGLVIDMNTNKIVASAGNINMKISHGSAMKGLVAGILLEIEDFDKASSENDDQYQLNDGSVLKCWKNNSLHGTQTLTESFNNHCTIAMAKLFEKNESDELNKHLVNLSLPMLNTALLEDKKIKLATGTDYPLTLEQLGVAYTKLLDGSALSDSTARKMTALMKMDYPSVSYFGVSGGSLIDENVHSNTFVGVIEVSNNTYCIVLNTIASLEAPYIINEAWNPSLELIVREFASV